MIITKQLDIQGADKSSSVSASTPRNNLVKELEKYSRHTDPVEKRAGNQSAGTSLGTSQGITDAVATAMAQGPILISKSKVAKPVAKDRPNILSKRPRFRPQQRSSSTESSSSTSSLASQALNLSTRLDPAPGATTRFLDPDETPISADAALAIPSPSLVTSTAIPTPSAITVSQKGVEKLLVPVTATDIFPATSDDVVIPTGNGYVVYKPAEQVAALLSSASLDSSQTSLVSSNSSSSAITQTTFSAPTVVTSLPLPNSGADIVTSMPPPLARSSSLLFPNSGGVMATCVPPQFTPSPTDVAPIPFIVNGIGIPVTFRPKYQAKIRESLKNKIGRNTRPTVGDIIISGTGRSTIDPVVLNKSVVASDNQKPLTPLFPPVVVTTVVNTYKFKNKSIRKTEIDKQLVYYKEHLPPYYVSKASETNTVGSSSYFGGLSGSTVITKTGNEKEVVYYQRTVLPSAPPVVLPVRSDSSSEGTVVKIPIIQRNLNIKSVVLPVSSPTSPLQMLPGSSRGVSGVPGQNRFVISQSFSKPIVMFSSGSESGSTGSFNVPVSSSSAVPLTVSVVSSSVSKPQQSQRPLVMLSTETSRECFLPTPSSSVQTKSQPVLIKPGVSLVPHTEAINDYPVSQTIAVQPGVTDQVAIPNKNPMEISLDDTATAL